MSIKRAEDLMIPLDKYPHIPYWHTLGQAMDELNKFMVEADGLKTLPRLLMVFNKEYQLLGVVRRRDVMAGLKPDSLASMLVKSRKKSPEKKKAVLNKMYKSIHKRITRPLTDVMHRIKVTVNHDDDYIQLISAMVASDLSLLPVMKEDQVVGVVRTVDVFKELHQAVHTFKQK